MNQELLGSPLWLACAVKEETQVSQQGKLANGVMTAEELEEYIRRVVAEALAARQAALQAEAARYAAELIAENDTRIQQLIDQALATAPVRYVVGFVRRDYTGGWLGIVAGMLTVLLPTVVIGGAMTQERIAVLGITMVFTMAVMGLIGYAYDVYRNQLTVEPLTTPIPFSRSNDKEG